MSTPTISSPSPAREAPQGPTLLAREAGTLGSETVSYTHLTLPTKA